jgi:hypothetical protein
MKINSYKTELKHTKNPEKSSNSGTNPPTVQPTSITKKERDGGMETGKLHFTHILNSTLVVQACQEPVRSLRENTAGEFVGHIV